ncbi:hypothetical protein F1880_000052 [Penicillium rolfsii]|nr:hypothetical protein F1880_000052 [Penicillium rolfsii]
MPLPQEPRSWQKPGFLISTDKSLLSVPAINHAFSLDMMYWVKPVPENILQGIVDNSFCFGLYEVPTTNTSADDQSFSPQDLTQIGFARLVGDTITFAYLTDFYVLPGYQGLGLGGWMIDCIGELLNEMPYLRWAMLRTSHERSRDAYVQRLGMAVLKSGEIEDGPVMMGRKGRVGGP